MATEQFNIKEKIEIKNIEQVKSSNVEKKEFETPMTVKQNLEITNNDETVKEINNNNNINSNNNINNSNDNLHNSNVSKLISSFSALSTSV
jgi:hypothetical protein